MEEDPGRLPNRQDQAHQLSLTLCVGLRENRPQMNTRGSTRDFQRVRSVIETFAAREFYRQLSFARRKTEHLDKKRHRNALERTARLEQHDEGRGGFGFDLGRT